MTQRITRGVWLTGFLFLAVLVSVASVVLYAITWQKLLTTYPSWARNVLASIAVLRPFSIVAMWFWSRSGVVAYVALSVAAMSVMTLQGQDLGLFGIIGAAILVALVMPKWKYMTWGLSSTPKEPHAA